VLEMTAANAYELTWQEAGTGRPLILIHAFPIDGRLYASQLSAASVGRIRGRLIAVDLPGFGQTPLPNPPPAVLTVEDIAASVARLIESLGLERPLVGGVAIGGYGAIELAARRPELVGGLILMGVKPAPDSTSMAGQREDLARRALTEGSTGVAQLLHAQPLGPQADGATKEKMRTMIAAADARAIAALVRGIARRPDPASALAELSVPALVIAGERDPFSHLEDVRNAAALIPGAHFVVLKGIGHMAPLEAPVAVSRAIADFVDKQLGGDAHDH
jgi:pimeloyl-ACP methyl ester carboxylesterase